MKARIVSLLAVLALVLALLPVPAARAETAVIDGNTLEVYASRSREEIGLHYGQALAVGETYTDRQADTYYQVPASMTAPYDAGVLTPDTHAAMTAMTNYYRWLVGAQPLQSASAHSDGLQAGALVRNWSWGHQVDDSKKPEDMSQELWDLGAGVWHNILAWGMTPRGAITGWLDEGYDLNSQEWDTIGHRQSLIGAEVSDLQFGYAGHIAIGVINGSKNALQAPFAAFPAPGWMPLQALSAPYSAWTLELNSAALKATDQVAVTVTDLATGASYQCTEANGKLTGSGTLAFVQPGNGEQSRYADGQSFRVDVTGLQDAVTDEDTGITYTVNFFDVRDYTPTFATGYNVGGWKTVLLTEDYTTPEELRNIGLCIPRTVQVQTDAGRTVSVPVLGSWQLDESAQCWRAAADVSKLPADVTDRNGVLAQLEVGYQVEDYTGSLQLPYGELHTGDSATIRVWQYTGGSQMDLYQVVSTGDTSQALLRFDNQSPNHSQDSTGYDLFTIDSLALSDSGRWYAFYYYPDGSWGGEAYLAGGGTLAVDCPHAETRTVTLPPTCTEPGYAEEVCALCGLTLSFEGLPALGHDYAETLTPATCTQAGLRQQVCTRCGDTLTETLEALGHDWSSTVTQAPTLTQAGERTYTCSRCDETYTETIAPLTLPCQPDYCPGSRFTDMPARGNWAHDPIDWALVTGVTNGKTADTFAPAEGCTRAQVVTFLWRAAGSPAPTAQTNPFADVTSGYYYRAVLWAVEKGITTGMSPTSFGPDLVCTRGQIVTFLWRYVRTVRPEALPTAPTEPAPVAMPFTDVQPGSYYEAAVRWAASTGVTTGMSPTTFVPNGTCTRAQVVTFLYRAQR